MAQSTNPILLVIPEFSLQQGSLDRYLPLGERCRHGFALGQSHQLQDRPAEAMLWIAEGIQNRKVMMAVNAHRRGRTTGMAQDIRIGGRQTPVLQAFKTTVSRLARGATGDGCFTGLLRSAFSVNCSGSLTWEMWIGSRS